MNNKQITIVSFMLGGALTLAFAPHSVSLALVASILGLLYIINNSKSYKHAGFSACVFGFGHMLTSLYWLVYPLSFEGDKYLWLMPIAALVVPAFMSLYFLLFGISSYFAFKASEPLRSFFIASLWTSIEILRSSFPLEFPWNLLGYTSFSIFNLAQTGSIIGVYGLSFLIVYMLSNIYNNNRISYLIVITLFFGTIGYGEYRTRGYDAAKHSTTEKVRLIQPGIANHFGDFEMQKQIFKRLIELSDNAPSDVKYIIWPEAAFPWPLEQKSDWLNVIGSLAPKEGAVILGADRLHSYPRSNGVKLSNSLMVINDKGALIDYYDKRVLVPFGEYIPMRELFFFLEEIAHLPGDFVRGKTNKTLSVANFDFFPMICYEGIFTNSRPDSNTDFFLNITNDSWFKGSIGLYQHYQMSRMRAIEYGIPLLRVATTGVTAVIDALGNELRVLPSEVAGSIDSEVPAKFVTETIYYNWNKLISMLLFFMLIGYVVFVISYVYKAKAI